MMLPIEFEGGFKAVAAKSGRFGYWGLSLPGSAVDLQSSITQDECGMWLHFWQ